MVDADIGGEPPEHRRQVVVRAARQCGVVTLPLSGPRPGGALELMLDVEQPHTDGRREQHGRDVDDQHRRGAEQPDEGAEPGRDRGRIAHDAGPRPPALARHAERQALHHKKHEGWTQAEHHQRVPVKPVAQLLDRRQRPVFVERQHLDGAKAAAIQIARGGMVDGMSLTPVVVRGQGEDADDPADPFVGLLLAKE